MLPAFEIFSTMAGVVFLTITTYGVLTENKSLLALGICLFSIIPIAGEIYLYSLSSKPIHLIFLLIFLSQLIISLPTKSNPKVAFGLSKKASFAILIINFSHGCLILSVLFDVPLQFGFMHLILALTMLYAVLKNNK